MSEEKNIRRRKLKVNVGKSPPSDKAIDRQKDFNALLGNYEDAAKHLYKKPLYKNPRLFIGLVLLLVIAALVWRAVEEEGVLESSREKSRRGAVIDPPLPAAAPEFHSVLFSIDRGERIWMDGAGWILIPPMAFGDLTGEARFEYRVFKDAGDIFASGIRMVTDTSNTAHLSSAGMIELNAYQNGNRLQLSEEKSIQVVLDYWGPEMKTPSEYDYDLYRLDTAQRKWVQEEAGISVEYEGEIDSLMDSVHERHFRQLFEVASLGIWNCDRLLKEEGLQEYHFVFQDSDGADLLFDGEIASIYMDRNSVVYYYADEKGGYNVLLNPDEFQLLVGIAKDKTLHVIRKFQLADIDWEDTESVQVLKMKSYPEISDLLEMRDVLGI